MSIAAFPDNARYVSPRSTAEVVARAEDWAGTNGAAWPAQWTTIDGALDIQSGAGRTVTAAAVYATAGGYLPGVRDGELLVRWQWTTAVSERYVCFGIRSDVTLQDNDVELLVSGTEVTLRKSVASSLTVLDTEPKTPTTGAWYWTRLRWQGHSFSARVWADGATEPAVWDVTATDASIEQAGVVAVRGIAGGSGAAQTTLFDQLSLTEIVTSSAGPRGWTRTLTPEANGAVGDCRRFSDATFAAASAALISDGAAEFTSADVGKTVAVSQGKGTTVGATVQANTASGAGSLPLTASVAPGIYRFGTGGTAELLHIRAVTGSSSPYTALLGQSNVSEVTAQARVAGDTVTRLDVHVTTIASVESATSATLAVAPTAGALAEYPVPNPAGHSVSGTTTRKTAWLGTDNTAAMQALADGIGEAGAEVVFAGRYLCTGPVVWPGKVKMRGYGAIDDRCADGASQVVFTHLDGDGFHFLAAGGVIEDVGFLNTSLYSSPPISGAGLRFDRGARCAWHRVAVVSFFNGIYVAEGDYYSLSKSHIYDCPNYGLFFTTPPGQPQDHGDQAIEGNVVAMMFSTWRPGVAAVHWESGGGIRFTANKINGREQSVNYRAGCYSYGLDLKGQSYTNTVDLMAVGNSIENCVDTAILIRPDTGGGQFRNMVITGNEIGYGGSVLRAYTDTPGNLAGLVFTGNTCPGNAYGVYLENVARVSIGGNEWGAYPQNYLFNVWTGCTDVNIDFGAQVFTGDGITLLGPDNTVDAASHGPFGDMRFDLVREIPTTTSASTYSTLWHLTPPNNQGALLELTLEGYAVGVGPVVLHARRAVAKSTGAPTLTAIGTDVATDGGTQVELLLDTASAAGELFIKVRLKSGGSATDFAGRAYLRYLGPLYTLRKGS